MKSLKVCLFIILCVGITACSGNSNDGNDAIIKQAELSDFEGELVDLMGEHPYVFEVDFKNKEVTDIIETVDYYENGEFIKQIIEISSGLTDEELKEPVRTVVMRQAIDETEDSNQEQWTNAVMTKGGSSTGTSLSDIKGRKEMSSSASGGVSSAPLFIGKKKVVATIVYSNKDAISIRNEIETEEDLKNATDYEQVYVISVELK